MIEAVLSPLAHYRLEAVTAVSYGHAEKIARSAAGEVPVVAEAATPPIDSRFYQQKDVRRILAERDIGALFRALKATGISYRRIAALVQCR